MQQTLSYLKSIGMTERILRVLSDNEVYAIFFWLSVRNSKLSLRNLMGESVLLVFLVQYSWWNDADVLNSILHKEIDRYVYVPVSKISKIAISLYTANFGSFEWRHGSSEFQVNLNALARDIWLRHIDWNFHGWIQKKQINTINLSFFALIHRLLGNYHVPLTDHLVYSCSGNIWVYIKRQYLTYYCTLLRFSEDPFIIYGFVFCTEQPSS